MPPFNQEYFEVYNQMAKDVAYDLIYYWRIASGLHEKTIVTHNWGIRNCENVTEVNVGNTHDEDYEDGGIHPNRSW
jgi:hypothetical protein